MGLNLSYVPPFVSFVAPCVPHPGFNPRPPYGFLASRTFLLSPLRVRPAPKKICVPTATSKNGLQSRGARCRVGQRVGPFGLITQTLLQRPERR